MSAAVNIHVALPVMDEMDLLPACLECIESQTKMPASVVICVNQPDTWWDIPAKKSTCQNNAIALEMLYGRNDKKLKIIDRSSKGKGWKKEQHGVGWARKTVMDSIAAEAYKKDIIICLDADTTFSNNYFESVVSAFSGAQIAALANPYYHRLCGKEAEDRAMLRYEIYMRNYGINMLDINSSYAFTALGSAMSCTVEAYRAIGGMTAKLSGEDFYFLQKLKKYGNVAITNTEKVFPAARFSDRVYFGTGPAMIKGNMGDWESYPIYHHSLFKEISATTASFSKLLAKDSESPMSSFLKEVFNTHDLWSPLRLNFKKPDNFIRACNEKVDGLRILQYLKKRQPEINLSDEQCLAGNINEVFTGICNTKKPLITEGFSFENASVDLLDNIRNYLSDIEECLQKNKVVL